MPEKRPHAATHDQAIAFEQELKRVRGRLPTHREPSRIDTTEFGYADVVRFTAVAPEFSAQKLGIEPEQRTNVAIYTRMSRGLHFPQRGGLQVILEVAEPTSELPQNTEHLGRVHYSSIATRGIRTWFYSESGLAIPAGTDLDAVPVISAPSELPSPEEIDFDSLSIDDLAMPRLHETPPVLFTEAQILISWAKQLPAQNA